MMWQLSSGWRGEPVLWPVSGALHAKARMIALAIPGAVIDSQGGGVSGPLHALFACMEAAGQKQDWSKLLNGSVYIRPEWRKLPEFQRMGAGFTYVNNERGVLNNDDMGLGKTVQTIAALGGISDHVKVVLCPAMLKTQWKAEIERWCASIDGNKYPGTAYIIWPKSDRRSTAVPDPATRWVVAYYLDYEQALAIADKLRKPYFLVVDEVHNVQGWGTKRAASVGTLSTFAAGRVGLTGSQLYNNVARMYGILSLICPGQWGSYGEYVTRYASGRPGLHGGWETGELSNAAELRNRMSAVSFRRTLHDVYTDLPFEAKFQTVWLDIGAGATSVQAAMMGGMTGRAAHLRAVNAAKTPVIVEQVKSDQLAGVASLTFAWMKDHVREIAKQVPGSLALTGDESNRLERITSWLARCKAGGITPALIATWDSMGTGANLQWAKVCNLAALSYTPDDLRQALHRMVRMGNEGELVVRLFIAKNTLDEHYLEILKAKLGEQFKLAGRKEKEKADFEAAFSERTVKDALKLMYERALREEKVR